MKLADAKEGYCGCVTAVTGNHHLLSRLVGIGIVAGSEIRVIKNTVGQPILFYCKDSVIALSRKDCEGIELERNKSERNESEKNKSERNESERNESEKNKSERNESEGRGRQ